MKKVAIIQSNYIPWKGYFDIINNADVFVFFDDVQMTKRDWRSRNKIKTAKGTEWLTVPFYGGRNQLISNVTIVQDDWQKKHLRTLQHNYQKSPFFQDCYALLAWLYKQPHKNLSEFNQATTIKICEILGIQCEFVHSADLQSSGKKDDRLIDICKKLKATAYISGPMAKNYIVEDKFMEAGIELIYTNYIYPEYPQLYPPFDHYVTILDLLFNCGPDAPYYIWGWRDESVTPPAKTNLKGF